MFFFLKNHFLPGTYNVMVSNDSFKNIYYVNFNSVNYDYAQYKQQNNQSNPRTLFRNR